MKTLFIIDLKNYDVNAPRIKRPSVRGIIIKDGKVAMIHSLKFDYYKFPGGGIENGETQQDTLIREVKEEAGLIVKPETITEFGLVQRIQRGLEDNVIFEQDNFYYCCEVEDQVIPQQLDDYESDEKFTLEFVNARKAIECNREFMRDKYQDAMILEREARVLELLIERKMVG